MAGKLLVVSDTIKRYPNVDRDRLLIVGSCSEAMYMLLETANDIQAVLVHMDPFKSEFRSLLKSALALKLEAPKGIEVAFLTVFKGGALYDEKYGLLGSGVKVLEEDREETRSWIQKVLNIGRFQG